MTLLEVYEKIPNRDWLNPYTVMIQALSFHPDTNEKEIIRMFRKNIKNNFSPRDMDKMEKAILKYYAGK